MAALAAMLRCGASAGQRMPLQGPEGGWGLWLGAVPAALLLYGAAAATQCEQSVAIHDPQQQQPHPSEQDLLAGRVQRFMQWLKHSGGDVAAISVQPSSLEQHQEGNSSVALGTFLAAESAAGAQRKSSLRVVWEWMNRSNKPVMLAEFPLSTAMTAQAAVEDPQVGASMQRLLEQHILDERTTVMVLLLIERLKGESSQWHPWISLLPAQHDTPLHWSEADLKQLRGTTLFAASEAIKRRVGALWAELQPFVKEMLQLAGVSATPSLEDWLWAYSTFWSRAQSIPIVLSNGATLVLEGIVPGLDFCNHQPAAACWWETSLSTPGAGTVQLFTASRHAPKPGQEIFIDYGGKSNEELLLLYGFALPNNTQDIVMVQCPVPPLEEWNDVTRARMQLLQARSLQPQFFLPSPPSAASAATASSYTLPPSVREVLEVLVMDHVQLFQRLSVEEAAAGAAAAAASPSGASAPPEHTPVSTSAQPASLQERITTHSMDMAVYSSLVSLLQLKMHQLEGPGGTGAMEKDEAQVARGPAPLTRTRKWHALLYRTQQKRVVRHHLQQASKQLQRVVQQLQELIAAEGSQRQAVH